MSAGMHLTHVIAQLQDARERVAHGWPSVAMALAGNPLSSALARLAESEEARYSAEPSKPWVQVLVDALALVEEAREMWGSTPDAMPPAASDLAPCGKELRMHLPDARRCAEMGLAWEDPGGLTRPQALCVLHLAVCLAQWREAEERTERARAAAHDALEAERRQSSAVAARAIWGRQSKPSAPALASDSRSLRELAREMGVLRLPDEKEED